MEGHQFQHARASHQASGRKERRANTDLQAQDKIFNTHAHPASDMLDILTEHKKNTTCEWVFPSPIKEGEPRNPTAVYHRFQIILERSHCKKVRSHDLRHTFATMAIENGMDIKTLSAMIGHVSAETTLNIYSHITDTMQRQAHIQECLRQDTRGMRGKARRAYKNYKSGNRRDEKGSECVTHKG